MLPTNHQSATDTFVERPWHWIVPRWLGAVVVAIGSLIIVSWHAHWTIILQVIPEFPAMQYNTALGFILCGSGLILLTTRGAKLAAWPGGLAGAFGLLTLTEYLTDWDLYIDQFLFKPYLTIATSSPGRMSPLTASCFVMLGVVFVLARVKWPRRLPTMGLLVSVLGVIATGSVLGYLAGINSAFGWGVFAPMAGHTALAFLLLGSGLWICIWREEKTANQENFHYARWLPLVAFLTLAVMITLVSKASFSNLKNALDWRKHTYEVLLTAHSFHSSLTDVQNGYTLTSLSLPPAPYQAVTNAALKQLSQLQELTRDNAIQQQRLNLIATDTAVVLTQARRMMETNDRARLKAALPMEATEVIDPVAGHVQSLVQAFMNEEERLLTVRIARADAEFHDTLHLLGLCGGLAVLLLLVSNYMTSQEFARRSRAEAVSSKLIAELQQALLEVKTLSGMIPICGWCKNVRADKGYWQSVEQYVHSHTDATFTHGVCPECSKKFQAEIIKANAKPRLS